MSLELPHVRLVLCEGVHDLWVMQRVLQCRHGYEKHEVPLGELPAPFGELIRGRIQKHYLEVLASAQRNETPQFSLAMKHPDVDFIFAFFTANGGLGSRDCASWLRELRKALRVVELRKSVSVDLDRRPGGRPWVQSTSICVVVDADDHPDKARNKMDKWWGEATNESLPTRGGLWIWPDGEGRDQGTLEAVLDDVDGGPDTTPGQEIVALLDEHAPKGCKYSKKSGGVARSARRTKARLGVHAQWNAPGASWATWLRDKGLSDEYIDDSDVLQRLGRWLVEGAPQQSI